MVYVLAQDNRPLMPTENHAKVRILLNQGRAKVIRKTPFTIKLLYAAGNETQKTIHALDTGSVEIGSSVYSDGRILYAAEIEIRNDIKDRMETRRGYRRNRRNRKTRYRKKRFKNRKNSKRSGRNSVTIQSKTACHEREIRFVEKILPVTCRVFETGTFDPHLIKNPALANENYRHWGYQQGTSYTFGNTHAYVLARDNHTCQCCHGKHKDSKLEVHHIIFRCNGGSDDESNLITLCHTCHKKLHEGKLKDFHPEGVKKGNLKHATQMNVIRSQLLKKYPDAVETFGYVTKENRQNLKLPKEHYIDACVTASGGRPFVFGKDVTLLKKKCISRHDYQKTKGKHSEQRIPTEKICGFRKFDKVRYLGREYFIKGRMSSGYAVLMTIDGKKADFSDMPKGFKTPKLTNCTRIGARKAWMVTEEMVIQSIV